MLLLFSHEVMLDTCDLEDSSLPGSSVHGISQARMVVWVPISFARGYSWPRNQIPVSYFSCIGWQVLYHWATREAHTWNELMIKFWVDSCWKKHHNVNRIISGWWSRCGLLNRIFFFFFCNEHTLGNDTFFWWSMETIDYAIRDFCF